MSEETPEVDFLTNGGLSKFLKEGKKLKAKIAASILTGRNRDFTEDSERLAKTLEETNIIGEENIPTQEGPIIIACNHPGINDAVTGAVSISDIFSKQRQKHGVSNKIHWMVTTKIPQRELKTIYKPLYGLINLGMKMLNHTYEFIETPPDEKRNTQSRAGAVLKARDLLNNPERSAIGIFPEGDVQGNGALGNFYNGVGELVRTSNSSEVQILPVGIYRDKNGGLTVSFGEVLRKSPSEAALEITQQVKHSLESVLPSA